MNFDIIAAVDERYGIGKNGKLPWRCPEDMDWFKDQTKNCICIVGRKTYLSLPVAARMRLWCYVVSNEGIDSLDGLVPVFKTFRGALSNAIGFHWDIKVIGGAQLYEEAIDDPGCRYIYLTKIKGKYDCDRFFPIPQVNKFQSAALHKLSDNACVEIYERVEKYE